VKTKFLKFVRENWAKSEYEDAAWDSDEEVGSVLFKDGNQILFEFKNNDFIQIEE
jgi:hypothetical protein